MSNIDMKYVTIILFLFLLIGLQSCGTSGSTSDSGVRSESNVQESQDSFRELVDYLQRIPGLRITGSGNNINVLVRGTSSFTSETNPLYVVDGAPRGTNYSEVNRSLNISEIRSVRLVTGSDAAAYGVRGANGVIEITLKR